MKSNEVTTHHQLKSKSIEDKYEIRKTIGKGTFGKVKLGINKETKEKVAIKILEKSKVITKEDIERVKREISMLTKFNHLNVVQIIEIMDSKDNYYIVMEYCEGGELFNYIVDKQFLDEDEAALFYYQLINGLEYIHSHNIVHRDLKPENLLLTKEKVLKIIDFGLSNYYNGTLLKTPCGSPCYASPEMVSGKKYNGYYIDVWSTGIILFATLCGYLPFEDEDNEILFKQILHCRLDYPSHISKRAIDLLTKILVPVPEERITIRDIKQHSFYLHGKEMFNSKIAVVLPKKPNDKKDSKKTDINDKPAIIQHPNKVITYSNLTKPYIPLATQSSIRQKIEQVNTEFPSNNPHTNKTVLITRKEQEHDNQHKGKKDNALLITQPKERNKTAGNRNPQVKISYITPLSKFLNINHHNHSTNTRTLTEGNFNSFRPITADARIRCNTSNNVKQRNTYLPSKALTKLSTFKDFSLKFNSTKYKKIQCPVTFTQYNSSKHTTEANQNKKSIICRIEKSSFENTSYSNSIIKKKNNDVNRKEPLHYGSVQTKTNPSLFIFADYFKNKETKPLHFGNVFLNMNKLSKHTEGHKNNEKSLKSNTKTSLNFDSFNKEFYSNKTKAFALRMNYLLNEKPKTSGSNKHRELLQLKNKELKNNLIKAAMYDNKYTSTNNAITSLTLNSTLRNTYTYISNKIKK